MIEDFYGSVYKIKKDGTNRHRGCCPNHSKVNQNLMVFENDNGGLNVYCHAGCTEFEVLSGLGLPDNVLYPPRNDYDREDFKKRAVIKALADKQEGDAIKLWNELKIITQCIEGRIFNKDKHPKNVTELWSKEAQAVRLMPKLFKEYYK